MLIIKVIQSSLYNFIGLLLILIVIFNTVEADRDNPFNNKECMHWCIPSLAAVVVSIIIYMLYIGIRLLLNGLF